MGLKSLALLIPPIRRLHEERAKLYEERARLTAQLREERAQLTAQLREERARLTTQLREERTQLRDQRMRLTAQLREERARHRAQQPMGRLLALLNRCGIDLVLDVGANEGQYARRLRREGFSGEIISFEPLNAAFATLQSRCDQDEAWSCHKLAVGAKDEQATINVSANSQSNSLLPVCDWTVETEPSVAYVGQETVAVRRLDGLVPELTEARRIFLKIDTQGFESRVIEGARSIVGRIAMLQLELAWQPGYEGQAAFGEMVDRLRGLGFEPVLITPAWVDRAGVIREVDIVFIGAAARQGV